MPSRKSRHRRRKPDVRRRAPPGSPPGTLLADPAAQPSKMRVLAFSTSGVHESAIENPADLRQLRRDWPVVWLNVDGLGDVKLIEQLGETFGLHKLALEDVIHTHQRPKVEWYGEHLFIVVRMGNAQAPSETEQVSIFLGRGFVLTFQDDIPGDCLDPVRRRIRNDVGKIRASGADYLAYALLDAIVDSYFPLLEDYGDQLDALESNIMEGTSGDEAIAEMHRVKRVLRSLRKSVWPQRETLHSLAREPSPVISDDTRVYLRDCYDHTVQILDLLETYRELASDLSDLYLSRVSYRTNEVMKVLTIITTIFIPLSFIAGVYGMNFDPDSSPWNMPELRSYWGYPITLALMAAVTAGLLLVFWRRGWLGRRKTEDAESLPE